MEDKLVVIMNEKLEPGRAMNALAHAMLGFGTGLVTKDDIKLNKYYDLENNLHDNISEMPIIILKANSNKIRGLRNLAQDNKANNVRFVDFTDTMSIGTYEEEYALTKTKKDEELEYWCIILLGPKELITEWTKKFSLYK